MSETENLGPVVAAFRNDFGVSPDGRMVRIVFLGTDKKTEIPIQFGADLLDKLMPLLLNAYAECERRYKGKNEQKVYRIREGSIKKATSGTEDVVVFEFTISTGQNFAFEVDKIGAKLIHTSLSKILGMVEDQSGPIETPTRQ